MADQKKLGDIKVKVDLDTEAKNFRRQTKKLSNQIKVGKSILELLTTAMYASPLTIYREYIQNAVDSIDQARNMNLYKASSDEPRVSINIDRQTRIVSILDTGTGIKTQDFEEVLTSFGNSPKRKQKARGFRGIGRLAGLAYCKELIFRTKASDELFVNEIKWDCMKLRSLLIDVSDECTLNEIVHQIAEVSSIEYDPSLPNRFFEVILNGVSFIILSPCSFTKITSLVSSTLPSGNSVTSSSPLITSILPVICKLFLVREACSFGAIVAFT